MSGLIRECTPCGVEMTRVVCFSAILLTLAGPSSVTANVTTLHFVSSCHLDVGFADTEANIVNRYFDHYFNMSMNVSNTLRQMGGEERLVFFTHPYLVYLYLDCPPNMGIHCPSKENITIFEDAVKRGDFVWHAMPFNSQLEVMDADLLDFSVKMSHALDKKYGLSPGMTMSQRDVPGTTRSIIPTLVNNGVQAVSVGVNPSSMPPAVPPVFTWKHSPTGQSIIAMWHAGGYGGMHGVSADSTVVVSGFSHALAFRFRSDNLGPPSLKEVLQDYAELRKLFPGANIVASNFDSFVKELLAVKDQLPVYTQEIGDTWIYGVPSDPVKIQRLREIMRARTECVQNGMCKFDDYRFFNFSRLLIKGPEHTWGKAVGSYLHDFRNWLNKDVHPLLNSSNYIDQRNSWLEQRAWGIDYAVEALADHPLRQEIEQRLSSLKASPPSLAGYQQISNLSSVFDCGPLELAFSPSTGAIIHLETKTNHSILASLDFPLGQIVYQTFTLDDFKKFIDTYDYAFNPKPGWMPSDFGKPGLTGTLSQTVSPELKALWQKKNATQQSFILQLAFNESLVSDYGAAAAVWVVVEVPHTGHTISLEITLINKTATKIPESLSVYFHPQVKDPKHMRLNKIGQLLDPLDVMTNGSKRLHGVDLWNGVQYINGPVFESKDTSVVCVGKPSPFPTPVTEAMVSDGFAFLVSNNIWDTNYLMWFPLVPDDASMKYRLTMRF